MSQALPHGSHEHFDEAVYHRRELGVASKSALDLIRQSPAHYHAWVTHELQDEDTKALRFGRLFHTAVLEPAKFERIYVAAPDFGDMRFKVNKEKLAEWKMENQGKTPVDFDEFESVRRMADAIRKHPLASRLLDDGKSEVTLRWEDEETGLQCKGRMDFVRVGDVVVDLKSTQNAKAEAFRKSCANFGYHRQEAFYRQGRQAIGQETRGFLFVAVETTAPFAVATYSLKSDAVEKGERSIREDLEVMAQCLKTNEWPGYPVRLQELDLPPWAA
jgi:exodeoxyribonuclease VIII